MAKVLARQLARRKLTPLLLAFSLLAQAPAQAQLAPAELSDVRNAISTLNSRNAPLALLQARQIKNRAAGALVEWMYLQRPDASVGFEGYAEFLAAHPDWPRRQDLAAKAEQRLNGNEKAADLLGHFSANPPQTQRGLTAYVGALRQSGQADAAAAAIRKFWLSAPFTPDEQADMLRRYAGSLSNEDLHMRIDRIISTYVGTKGEKPAIQAALTTARRLAADIPLGSGHQNAVKVRLKLIEMIRTTNRDDVTASQRQLADTLVGQVPAGERRDNGFIYDYARWLEYSDQPERAGQVLAEQPNQRHGDPAYAWRVREMVARDLIERGDAQTAYRVASEHGLKPADDLPYREAEWLAGWIALRFAGKPEEAAGHFRRQYENSKSSISKARGAYWMGRAAHGSGHTEVARQWYETAATIGGNTFYGQAAAVDLYGEVNIHAPDAPDPGAQEQQDFERKDLVKAARIALQAGQPDLAKSLVIAQANASATQAEATLVLKLARAVGGDALVAFSAKRVGSQGFAVGREGYPVLRNLPARPAASLILSIIRQESAFDPQARSPAGALGKMQLMPATARAEAKKLGIPFNPGWLQSNPDYNVRLGSSHLQSLLNEFDGSHIKVAIAYNAGKSRVSQWEVRFGPLEKPLLPIVSLPADSKEPEHWRRIDWLEMTPFSETRNYIMRIIEGERVYRAILSGENRTVRLGPGPDWR